MKTKRVKRRITTIATLILITTLIVSVLTACSDQPQGQTKNLKDKAPEGDLIYTLNKDNTDDFVLSDGYSNGYPFNVEWSKDDGIYTDDSLKLTMTKSGDTLYGGEAKSVEHFGYGDFEVSMKPSNTYGSASTFFLYTGPTDDPDGDGTGNPHDEVDIEFLGKDTTKVQFNYFVNSQGGHEYWHELGFDASKEFHTYGFRWAEDYIVWFVDGKPVYKVTKSAKNPLPSTPSNIIMNYWSGAGDIEGWMGKYAGPTEGEGTEYQWIKTSAAPVKYNTGNTGEDQPSESETVQVTFSSDDGKYTVENGTDKTNITYTGITNNYANVAGAIPTAAQGKNSMQFSIKNNGTAAVSVRADVLDTAGGHIEKTATMDGAEARVDTEYGGCYFDNIPAGKEVVVTIDYDGTATTLLLFIDSATYGDTQTHSGNITVSAYRFTKKEQQGQGGGDQTGTTEVDWSKVAIVSPAYGTEHPYTLTANADATNVTYSAITGNSYAVVTAYVGGVAAGMNCMRLVIKNNGTATANVRIDLQDAANKNLEKTATMNGTSVRVDSQWGGCYFDNIAAGQEVEIIVYYEGDASTVIVFIDSANYTDTATHSGNLTISGHKFAKQ